jgi:hypothetical protein
MYIYMYIYIYTCVYIYIHIQVLATSQADVYIYIHIHTYQYIYTYIYKCLRIQVLATSQADVGSSDNNKSSKNKAENSTTGAFGLTAVRSALIEWYVYECDDDDDVYLDRITQHKPKTIFHM